MTHRSGAPEWLGQFAVVAIAHITELIRDIPCGRDEERATLAAASNNASSPVEKTKRDAVYLRVSTDGQSWKTSALALELRCQGMRQAP
jgi:hypothetical protein